MNIAPLAHTTEHLKKIRASWHPHLGDDADEIIDRVFMFFAPDLSLALRPPLGELETWCRGAAFWRTVTGLRLHTPAFEPAPQHTNLWLNLCHEFRSEILERLPQERRERLENCLRCKLYPHLRERFSATVGNSFNAVLAERLWNCLWESVTTAASFALVKDRSKNFSPLLALHLRGNPLVGFDENDRAVVLTSS